MQPVHQSISVGADLRRALSNKATNVEKEFPIVGHCKHIMRGIAVIEYSLKNKDECETAICFIFYYGDFNNGHVIASVIVNSDGTYTFKVETSIGDFR